MRRTVTLLGVVALALLPAVSLAAHTTPALATAPTAAITYAPVDQPGPVLTVPRSKLRASLHCSRGLREATRDPVLLIPGTTVDPPEAYSWNYEKAFHHKHIPFCDVTVPNHTDGDIQIAAEYVVHAIRAMEAKSQHKVVLLGWSQGASTLPRWALRFWPDARRKVASLIGLEPLNNLGSPVANGICLGGSCIPAGWQQAIGSHFMAALDSRQKTFKNIAYTVVYSRDDEVVTPNVTGVPSVLPPGPNVTNAVLQNVCPLDLSEHLLIIASPTAYAIAMNAINHPGRPADLAQISVNRLCLPGTAPEVSLPDLVHYEGVIVGNVYPHIETGKVSKEPPLACYVTARCDSREP